MGERPEDKELENVNSDLQIEDFIYPKVFCFLVNHLLKKKNLKQVNADEISKKITKPAYKNRGILHMIENEKNDANPDTGQVLNFTSTNKTSEQVKKGLAGFFNIQGNKTLANLIYEEDKKYPSVKKFLEKISYYSNM